jgi:hypothetical protein
MKKQNNTIQKDVPSCIYINLYIINGGYQQQTAPRTASHQRISLRRITFTLSLQLIAMSNHTLQAGPVFCPWDNRGKANSWRPSPPGTLKIGKISEALQYCDSNEFIELTVGTSHVLISKAATNNICSNKHKA